MAALLALLLAASFLGVSLINEPFDPANRILPRIYFSDHWHFEPHGNLKHRRKIWGGLLVALIVMTAYARLVRGDRLAGQMALIGVLAGGFGFVGGQSVQAFRNWNPQFFTEGVLSPFAHIFQMCNW